MREKKGVFLSIFGALLILSVFLGILFKESILFLPFTLLSSISSMILLQLVMWVVVEASVPQPKKVAPVPREVLENQLLNLNNPQYPFEIRKKGDLLIFVYKLAEASWYEWFRKAQIESTYELKLLLDDAKSVARAQERTRTIRKWFGPGGVSLSRVGFSGWTPALFQKEKTLAVTKIAPPKAGTAYDLRFNSRQFRQNILAVIARSGWRIYPCTLSLKMGV